MLYNIKSVYLHCVFHGIRFKVNEDWVSGKIPFFFLYMFPFIFLLPEQKKNETKRKFAVCIFLPTPVLFSAKQKELATLKQLFVLHAPKSTSASRQKNEAGSFWSGCGINVASLVIGYLLDVSMKKLTLESCTSNSEAHLSPPLEDRHLVEGVKKIGRISVKNKKLFERSEFFLFRKSTRFLAPEREPAVFLFCYLFSFCSQKEKSNSFYDRRKNQSLIFNILAPNPSIRI